MRKAKLLLSILLLLGGLHLFAQNELNVYYCGLTIHGPGDKNSSLMPLKLDTIGVAVVNIGGGIEFRHYFNERWSIDLVQTVQADCALKLSAGTGIGIAYDLLRSPVHHLKIIGGPGVFFRDSWRELNNYIQVNQLKLSKNEKWEYIVVPFVPRFEYSYYPSNGQWGLTSYCIFDPIDLVCNIGFGASYRFKSKELNLID